MIAPDAFREALRARRSVRNYQPRPVPRVILEELLTAATWAPSAGNRQDWEFVVVDAGERIARLATAVKARWEELVRTAPEGAVAEALAGYRTNFDWFDQAPVVVVVTARKPEAFLSAVLGEQAPAVYGSLVSAAMAAQNLLLAASAAGLGACCLTGPLAASEPLRQELGLGPRREPVCLVTLGYPATQNAPPPRSRKPLSSVARFLP